MEFRDLKKQYLSLKPKIDFAMQAVINSASFISGSQVFELEERLANYVGVKHCITCANGTDAITLALKVWNIGLGDAVFVPDFTFFSSGECPACEGATPVFVDVITETYNLDPNKLELAILRVKAEGRLTPKAVIAVDLFGQPADYEQIKLICKKHNLFLLEDGAQGFGGSIRGKKACSFGDISTTSFFPAKPLGCYGDGGALFTDNDEWATLIRSLSVHGKSEHDKYDNIRLGMNSRLDTLQASILLVKLDAFIKYELDSVNRIAHQYNDGLNGCQIQLPMIKQDYTSSWAQYTVRLPNNVCRTDLQNRLKMRGIPTNVYYPKPMHRQGAFAGTYSENSFCPVTEQLCEEVLSFPMHPYLTEVDVNNVLKTVKEYFFELEK